MFLPVVVVRRGLHNENKGGGGSFTCFYSVIIDTYRLQVDMFDLGIDAIVPTDVVSLGLEGVDRQWEQCETVGGT